MPITFHSPAHGDVIMLERDARYLIRLMNHSDSVPGAIDAEGVPAALDRLQDELARLETTEEANDEEPDNSPSDSEGEDEAVGWRRRAWPLCQLLTAAIEAESHIRWD